MLDRKSVTSSPLTILYDLPYSYRNYVFTLSNDTPKINLIVRRYFCKLGPWVGRRETRHEASAHDDTNVTSLLPMLLQRQVRSITI